MDKFTASNGCTVRKHDTSIGQRVSVRDEDPVAVPGYQKPNHIESYLDPRQADALREFFQAERDEELGRWRDPNEKDFPGYVVYQSPECSDADLRVMCEQSGDSMDYTRSEDDGYRRGHPWENPFARAARAYFAAHPEPKPWHSAEAGEVWVLSIDGSEDIPCIVTPSGPDFEPIAHPVWATFARGSDRITDARRIWPEVSDAD